MPSANRACSRATLASSTGPGEPLRLSPVPGPCRAPRPSRRRSRRLGHRGGGALHAGAARPAGLARPGPRNERPRQRHGVGARRAARRADEVYCSVARNLRARLLPRTVIPIEGAKRGSAVDGCAVSRPGRAWSASGTAGPNLAPRSRRRHGHRAALALRPRRGVPRHIHRRYPLFHVTACLDDVLADPEVDASCCAIRVFTQKYLKATTTPAGKHVFVEQDARAHRGCSRGRGRRSRATDVRSDVHDSCRCAPQGQCPRARGRRAVLDLLEPCEPRAPPARRQRRGDLGPHDFSILRYGLGERPATILDRPRLDCPASSTSRSSR